MKNSIRTKFNLGILFLFVIISVLSIFSAIFLNRLSKKTSEILKENHTSVIYARDMAEGLMKINQEITWSSLLDKHPDSLSIVHEFVLFSQSLLLEKNNITEPGEDKLVSNIEKEFNDYQDAVVKVIQSPKPAVQVLTLQMNFSSLYQHLMLLSQINGIAIENKTEAAKILAKKSLTQMSILGTLCFLIALSFTFRFATYFNERFFQLYNGIKEIVSSNYGQRLYFEGKDEFHEISLVFNEMAEKLSENNENKSPTLGTDSEKDPNFSQIQELKKLLVRLKNIEVQSLELITRLEDKK